jgi:RHS repeat-associated protein
LIEVVDKVTGQIVAQFRYFADDRRARKRVFSGGVLQYEIDFFYDGRQCVEEQDAASGTTRITYVWNDDEGNELCHFERTADHPLGTGRFWVHADARNDVVAITDASGVVVEKRFYDAYGAALDASKQPLVQAGASGLEYAFKGRRLDPETGNYYFSERYYDPNTGRYLQRNRKSAFLNPGDLYTFQGNNPVNARDPNGSGFMLGLTGDLVDASHLNDYVNSTPIEFLNGPFSSSGLGRPMGHRPVPVEAGMDLVLNYRLDSLVRFYALASGWRVGYANAQDAMSTPQDGSPNPSVNRRDSQRFRLSAFYFDEGVNGQSSGVSVSSANAQDGEFETLSESIRRYAEELREAGEYSWAFPDRKPRKNAITECLRTFDCVSGHRCRRCYTSWAPRGGGSHIGRPIDHRIWHGRFPLPGGCVIKLPRETQPRLNSILHELSGSNHSN